MKDLIIKTIRDVREHESDDVLNEYIDSMLLVEIFLAVEEHVPEIDKLVPEIRRCETVGQLITLLESTVEVS